MNLWQTLDCLANANLRKQYNYDGYCDTNNSLRTLILTWRRDSFAEKNVNVNHDEPIANITNVSNNDKNITITKSNNKIKKRIKKINVNDSNVRQKYPKLTQTNFDNKKVRENVKNVKNVTRKMRYKNLETMDAEYVATMPTEYTDLIKCIFNLPRISAALERLMGTNIVRLTDRNYMKELGQRIEDDYRNQLQKRIKARELKEIERERLLIIEGRSNDIPPELSEDPIFVVNKKADVEIQKTRAKLKTNREKNSERLKLQGVKWERERLQHEEEDKARIEEMRKRYKQQKALEEKFNEEDEVAGMNLLRIDNEDWRPCEKELKKFLEEERAKMKERSLRVPTPFSSDPKDMMNIIRAKKAKAKAEKETRSAVAMLTPTKKIILTKSADLNLQQHKSSTRPSQVEGHEPHTVLSLDMDDMIEDDKEKQNLASDDASDMSSGESFEEGSTISLAKQRYALMLQQELENDVAAGLLISKEQYDHLRYEDEKIMQLRNARDIRELYQLAEEIIIGDRIPSTEEEEEEEEEEVEAEEEEIK